MSPASVITEPQLYYIHTDHLGTPQELTDREGQLHWVGHYRAWGELAKANDSEGHAANVEMPLCFQGQYFDAETGLHYSRFRYYDPQVGRFTTQDPISLAGGINLYQYAPNPVQWVDPFGLTGEWVDPGKINFSQRTISDNTYANAMKNGEWDWNRSPLNVMDSNGQLVTYDNRRLDAALEADVEKVKVIRVDPNAPHPDSTTGRTWEQQFDKRFNDKRNKRAGGVVPSEGLSSRPIKCPRKEK